MLHIIEGSYTGQVNLSALPVGRPVFALLVKLCLDVVVWLALDLDDLYAFPLRPMDLPPHRLVVVGWIDLDGIESFLSDSDDRTPTEFHGEVLFRLPVDAAPNRLEGLGGEVLQERADDARNLLRFAKRVAENDSVAVEGNVTDCCAGSFVTPYGPGRIDPGCICGVTIPRDELRNC